MSNHDHNRLSLLALKLRAGLPLPPEDQALWDQSASLHNKVDAGVTLTEAERERWERIRNIRMSVRSGGVLVVEDGAAPQTVEDWKKIVAKSRGTPVKLTSDLPLENKAENDAT